MGRTEAVGYHETLVLHAALRTRRLRHAFQPIWSLRSGDLLGFEALARFPDDTPPDAVWRAAHACGAWLELDRLSAYRAVLQARHLPGRLFINMSARHLGSEHPRRGPSHPSVLRHRSHPGSLVFEVTEDDVGSPERAGADAMRLQELGVCLALDDAGSGAATLQRLCLLGSSLAFVKLDRPVVSQWLADRTGELPRWVRWARRRRIPVIAEGVEDRAAAPPLTRAGIEYVQGYAFGRPAPARSWTAKRLSALRPASGRRGPLSGVAPGGPS